MYIFWINGKFLILDKNFLENSFFIKIQIEEKYPK